MGYDTEALERCMKLMQQYGVPEMSIGDMHIVMTVALGPSAEPLRFADDPPVSIDPNNPDRVMVDPDMFGAVE